MRCDNCGTLYAASLVACPQCGARAVGDLRRPVAITFLGVVHVLGGLLLLLGAAAAGYFRVKAPAEVQPVLLVVAVVLAVLALLQLACGTGLLKLRNYGRILLIIIAALGLVIFPIGTILSILILVYMLKPGMRILFSERPASSLLPEEAAAVGEVQRSGLGTGIIVFCVVALAGSLVFVPIFAAVGLPSLLTAIQRGKQIRTMSDIRAVATAVETYYGEKDAYPPAESFDELVPMLSSTVDVVPTKDGWGRELRYQVREGADSYAIGSAGKDGSWEREDLFAYDPGETVSPTEDIVFADGAFVRAPTGTAEIDFEWTPEEVEGTTGDDDTPDAAVAGNGPAPLTLQLLDWRMRRQGREAILEGAAVNLSSVALVDATVVAVFVTETGAEVATASAPLPRLEPGGTTPFTVRAPYEDAMFTATITVLDAEDNAIPMVVAEPVPEEGEPAMPEPAADEAPESQPEVVPEVVPESEPEAVPEETEEP